MAEDTDLMVLTGDFEAVAERPKALERSGAGADEIGANEIQLPRLTIAQGLSPQITPGDAQYIEKLTLFDMFNDLTREIYGKGPLKFIPLRRDIHNIEFIPRSEGGGVVDLNVPFGDPRLEWTRVPGSTKGIPPRATTFVEFVILLLRPGKIPSIEPMVMPIKLTNKHNTRAAKNLRTFIKLRREGAIYSGIYTVDTLVPAKNDDGTWGVFRMDNAGYVPVDTPQGMAVYNFAKKFHDDLKGKTLIVEREAPADEEFDTAQMDKEGQADDRPTATVSDM